MRQEKESQPRANAAKSCVVLFVWLAACGMQSGSSNPDDPQIPPTASVAAMSAWLSAGHYKAWQCEAVATEKTAGDASIHVHGINRVCVNDLLAQTPSPGATGAWPAGVAAVKEVYSGTTLKTLYAEVKLDAQSNGGAGWYWYNGSPGSDGSGAKGRSECTGCHQDAASDAGHPGAGDFVYSRGD
jgi:hypothetical protein